MRLKGIFVFFHLAAFLLASLSKPEHRCLYEVLNSVLGTQGETLETVQALFVDENAFDVEYLCHYGLKPCSQPEILEFFLSKCTKNSQWEYQVTELIKGLAQATEDPGYKKIQVCLQAMNQSGFAVSESTEIDLLVEGLVHNGSVELVKLFASSGTKAHFLLFVLCEIKEEKRQEMLEYLIESGLKLSRYSQQVVGMFILPSFHVAHFEWYLERGLPLHTECLGVNLIEWALIAGRLDIAYALYKRNFCISSKRIGQHVSMTPFRNQPSDLVNYIALHNSFASRVKILWESKLNPESPFYFLPFELLVYHLSMYLTSDEEVEWAKLDLIVD